MDVQSIEEIDDINLLKSIAYDEAKRIGEATQVIQEAQDIVGRAEARIGILSNPPKNDMEMTDETVKK